MLCFIFFFFSSRRRHTRYWRDWSSDVCSSDLTQAHLAAHAGEQRVRAFTLVFNVGPAIAFGIAPLVSGALIARFDMRAAFIFAAACTAFSLIFFSRFAPRPERKKEDESAHSSYREALAEPSVKPLLGMQFAT